MRQILCRLAAGPYFGASTAIFLLILGILLGNASNVVAQSYSTATGIPAFAAPEPVEIGFADAANGRLHLTIHWGSYPQRGSGQPEEVSLIYDSNIWQVNPYWAGPYWTPISGSGSAAGWNLSENIQAGRTSNGPTSGCRDDELWQDRNGTVHAFPLQTNPWNGNCTWSGSAYATDSSGFLIKCSRAPKALFSDVFPYMRLTERSHGPMTSIAAIIRIQRDITSSRRTAMETTSQATR